MFRERQKARNKRKALYPVSNEEQKRKEVRCGVEDDQLEATAVLCNCVAVLHRAGDEDLLTSPLQRSVSVGALDGMSAGYA